MITFTKAQSVLANSLIKTVTRRVSSPEMIANRQANGANSLLYGSEQKWVSYGETTGTKISQAQRVNSWLVLAQQKIIALQVDGNEKLTYQFFDGEVSQGEFQWSVSSQSYICNRAEFSPFELVVNRDELVLNDQANGVKRIFDARTGKLSRILSGGAQFQFSYDENRLQQVLAEDGSSLEFQYTENGSLKTEKNTLIINVDQQPVKQTTEIFYDQLGRKTQLLVTLNDADKQSSYVTEYYYDADSYRLAGIKNNAGQDYTFKYRQIGEEFLLEQINNQQKEVLKVSYSDGKIAQYSNQSSVITINFNEQDSSITMLTEQSGNSSESTFTFNKQDQLEQIRGAEFNFDFSFANDGKLALLAAQGDYLGSNLLGDTTKNLQAEYPALANDGRSERYYIYSNDTRELTYVIDQHGELVEHQYNKTGQRTRSVHYLLKPELLNSINSASSVFDIENLLKSLSLQQKLDGTELLTVSSQIEFQYDAFGHLVQQEEVQVSTNRVVARLRPIFDSNGELLSTIYTLDEKQSVQAKFGDLELITHAENLELTKTSFSPATSYTLSTDSKAMQLNATLEQGQHSFRLLNLNANVETSNASDLSAGVVNGAISQPGEEDSYQIQVVEDQYQARMGVAR